MPPCSSDDLSNTKKHAPTNCLQTSQINVHLNIFLKYRFRKKFQLITKWFAGNTDHRYVKDRFDDVYPDYTDDNSDEDDDINNDDFLSENKDKNFSGDCLFLIILMSNFPAIFFQYSRQVSVADSGLSKRGANPWHGAWTYYFTNCCGKLHQNEDILARMGSSLVPSPKIRHWVD